MMYDQDENEHFLRIKVVDLEIELDRLKNEIQECLKEGTTVSQSEALVLRKETVERLKRIAND